MYWGTDASQGAPAELQAWEGFLAVESPSGVARRTAELLAQGAVVGWVQGRSEFSPRALGNRSVLADPRAADNRERVDRVLRRQQGCSVLAPSVLEGDARALFELPEGTAELPYMAFGVRVRQEWRQALGVTVRPDGTAWPQTVSRHTNPRFAELIAAWKELTGVPALLNTSFSTGAEPMVDSVEDAVVAFLTSELDYLVVDGLVAQRRAPSEQALLALRLLLPPYVRLDRGRRFVSPGRMA